MSHVIHENVEEYRTEDLNSLVSCLIPHSASLRYIFMILPLFLVLVPEASSDNMTEIRKHYENVLVIIIMNLERRISLNITSSCNLNTNKCYSHPPENTSITCLTLCLKVKANCTKISSDLKDKMKSLSELTTGILNKTDYTFPPPNPSRCNQQCRKIIRKSDCTHTLCCLKNVVSAMSSWWKMFLYHGFPQRE